MARRRVAKLVKLRARDPLHERLLAVGEIVLPCAGLSSPSKLLGAVRLPLEAVPRHGGLGIAVEPEPAEKLAQLIDRRAAKVLVPQ